MGGDALVRAGDIVFLVECRFATDTVAVQRGIEAVGAAAAGLRNFDAQQVVPILAVPFMGEAGRRLCEAEGCSWLDLSGNANIRAPGLLVRIEGMTNRFKRRGRPASVFAPQASRIARHLLTHPHVLHSQHGLVQVTGMDNGYVSRIVHNLVASGLVAREGRGLRVHDRELLLRAWREEYDFARHRRIEGHVPARDGAALVRILADPLANQPHSPPYAATGLAAAWCLGRFAAFRTATFYVHDETAETALADLSFRRTDRGANVWLIVPNDIGVFQGVATHDGVHCAAPVQVYLDLLAHAERGAEVAAELKAHHLDRDRCDG